MHKLTKIVLTLFLMATLGIATLPVAAQSVVLRPEDVLPKLKTVSKDTFFVNGPAVYGNPQSDTAPDVFDGGRLLLTLAALRLIDQGKLALDTQVHTLLPEEMDDYPFKVAVTIRHLLSESAGFAVPPHNAYHDHNTIPLRHLLIELRTAGQVSATDPTGWKLLSAVIEKLSAKPLENALFDLVVAPLGGTMASLDSNFQPYRYGYSGWDGNTRTPAALYARMLAAVLSNRDANGLPFLSTLGHNALVGTPVWHLFPGGPARTAAGWLRQRDGQLWLEAADCQMIFPREGVAFVMPGCGDEQVSDFKQAVLSIAYDYFPPHAAAPVQMAAVAPTDPSGRYVRADAPSASLRHRVGQMQDDWLQFKDLGGNGIIVSGPQNSDFGKETLFEPTSPLQFEDSTGHRLVLAPARLAGYAYVNDILYRYVGPLGHVDLIGKFLPWILVILSSAILHLRSKTARNWHRMALFTLVGTLLVCFGLIAEWYLWPTVLYNFDLPSLIILWRAGLNIGLMLLLTVPLFALSFVRHGPMPEKGFSFLFAGPHLALLSAAAMALFLVTVALGLAGEFSAF